MIRRREFIALLGGAAATWPLAARAQQPTTPVIGFFEAETLKGTFVAFLDGLGAAGYVVGQNVAIEYSSADGHYDRLPALASKLVGRHVAVIVAGPRGAVFAAKSATAVIPIIFMSGSDPVRRGLVASLNRPGGNLTGVTILGQDLTAKRLSLLHELVPQATRIAVLSDSTSGDREFPLAQLRAAAQPIGVSIQVEWVGSEGDFDAAFAAFARDRVGAFFVVSSAFLAAHRERLTTLAARYALPAVYPGKEFADVGGLLTYGPSVTDAYRQVGIYTGRILKGEKPADLPVLQPTRFETVVNLKTAKALGLAVPPSLLAIADEVIE
jgi:putative ABC transport system substrate-binding protein